MAMYAHRDSKGREYLQTGDPVYDQWEKDHAEGRVPDLWSAYSDRQKRIIRRSFQKKNTVEEAVLGAKPGASELDNFKETY